MSEAEATVLLAVTTGLALILAARRFLPEPMRPPAVQFIAVITTVFSLMVLAGDRQHVSVTSANVILVVTVFWFLTIFGLLLWQVLLEIREMHIDSKLVAGSRCDPGHYPSRGGCHLRHVTPVPPPELVIRIDGAPPGSPPELSDIVGKRARAGAQS